MKKFKFIFSTISLRIGMVSCPLTEKEFIKEKEKIPNKILLENIDTKKGNL